MTAFGFIGFSILLFPFHFCCIKVLWGRVGGARTFSPFGAQGETGWQGDVGAVFQQRGGGSPSGLACAAVLAGSEGRLRSVGETG